jgi:hypothetical protein
LDDERATLTVVYGMNNWHTHYRTVGFASTALLAQLMSCKNVRAGPFFSAKNAEVWWAETQIKDERKYLESVLFPDPKEVKGREVGVSTLPTNPVALRMLLLRYPESLSDLYRQCLKLEGVQSFELAGAVRDSALSASQKGALFVEAAGSKEVEHRSTGIRMLGELGAQPLGPALVKALSAKAPFGTGDYGSSPSQQFARHVLSSNSSEAFDALARAMKRSELGYRIEAMSAFRHVWANKLSVATKKLAFALLMQFKDDAERYDPLQHDFDHQSIDEARKSKWVDSNELSEYKTPLAARDFAFVCIAWLLEDEVERGNSWNRDQWAQFRTRIRGKLAEWRAKHGGAPLPGDWFR